MRVETLELSGADGLKLFGQRWLPEEPRAQVMVVHGIGEHSGRYAALAERFAAAGYAVLAFDHRGHGRSEGARLFPESFEDYVRDLEAVVQGLQASAPGPRVFLGHSMGATIALYHALRYPASADLLVISGVSLHIEHNLSAPARRLLGYLGAVLPRFPVKAVDIDTLSRDPAMLRLYREDPLVHRGKLSARMGLVLLEGPRFVRERMGRLKQPLLILHGAADRLVLPSSSEELYAGAGSADKTMKLYPERFHEIYNDVGKDEVVEDVLAWLETRVSPAPAQ